MHRNTTLWCMVMLLSNIFNHRQLPYLQVFASVVFLFAFFPLSVAQDACPGDRTPPVMNCPATPIQVNTDPGICGAYVNFNVTAVDDCDVPTRLRNFTLLGSNNNRAYFLSSSSFNWQAALQDAAANGGHLVSLTSLVENNIVAGNGLAWIGLTDQGQEGSMNWITGEAVSFINWDTGEPDDGGGTGEDFGAIQNDGTWTDLDGTTSLPYIMELEGAVISPATGSMVSGDLFPVGTTTVTYTATDESRNSSSCSFTVVVSDLEAPTFIDPLQDTVINCNTAIPSSIVTANDPCNANPIAAVLVSDTTIAGSCAQAFAIVRTWEATDSNGNTNTLTQTISVQDTTAPSLICMAPAVELDANGMGQITTADVDNGSSDNCSATLNFRLSQSTFDCSDVGMLAITLFAEDDCGNVD
ncbi:MAG: HYR domain-containing protein, partial [Bacteroidota bacterium]